MSVGAPRSVLGWFGAHAVAIVAWMALLALALLEFNTCAHSDPTPPNVHADRIRVDTVTAWKVRQDTITVRVDRLVAYERQRASATRVAAARMESAAVAVVDSAPYHAYALERERGDTLQALGWRLSVALDTMTADRDRWKYVADTSVALLGHVQRDLETASRGCRIARIIPCPSRKVVLVGTAVATYVVVKHPAATRNTIGAAFRWAIP